ncbi:sugar transferase [Salinilacustrithrix flava]|uniref:sugar transferase n=1 Tax=Salinilacustrithrix flava TaxID=2957203 RepID=UPI003D7C3168
MKRAFDVVVAGAALVVLSPVLAVVAVLVRLRLGSPVLFRQERAGLGGAPFVLTKLRTMTDERGPDGELLPDEERLPAFGSFLRSTSLDELPELVHVLRGEMSLVGPRPLPTKYLPRYSPRQARRHEVRPGITGWAQVNGRNAAGWAERLEMDVWYVENRSMLLDLKILWRTLRVVVSREGVAEDGAATMTEFLGTDE